MQDDDVIHYTLKFILTIVLLSQSYIYTKTFIFIQEHELVFLCYVLSTYITELLQNIACNLLTLLIY